MIFRESGNDWDKELAEDVKGECEEKYGKVEAIKVEKETQVRVRPLHFAVTVADPLCREKSTSSSTALTQLKTLSRVLTGVGLEANRSRPFSSRTPSCRHTSNCWQTSPHSDAHRISDPRCSITAEMFLILLLVVQVFREMSSEVGQDDVMQKTLIPNWTSDEFVGFVDTIGGLVDELAADLKDDEKEWARCEDAWKQVLFAEEKFWPEV